MKKINWLIISSRDRGTEFGVGTFIRELSSAMAKHHQINVIVVQIGSPGTSVFHIEVKQEITYFKFPNVGPNKQEDFSTRNDQMKIAKAFVRLILMHLPDADENVVHLNYIFQYFIASELKRVLNCKLILTQHLFVLPSPEINANLFDVESEIYRLVDRIATVTHHGKVHLIKKKVDSDKIRVIYNGMDPNWFDIDGEDIYQKYDIDRKRKLILYSGRLDEIKGLKYLINAFGRVLKKVPGCQLVLAGNGNYEAVINEAKAISSHISFLGFVPFRDVVALYRSAEIGVIPSLEEHCSYVALEMLFCGLPVVASKVGGLKEIFTHGETALLTEMVSCSDNFFGIAPDEGQMADAMVTLLENELLRQQFGQKAKERALRIFTADRMAWEYIDLYKQI